MHVAEAIAAMDIMLNPFTDGISTRRGSALAALQQGVPLVTTKGMRLIRYGLHAMEMGSHLLM